jgi:nitroreductase
MPPRRGVEMDVLAAIRQRISVRSYSDGDVDSAVLGQLLRFASEIPHLTGTPPRVALISGVEAVNDVLTFMIGSYGLVQNAPHLLVGVMEEDSEEARVDLGYVLEQVVLEATRLGLGTCWITGSYDAERAGSALELTSDEVAAAVCALGYPTEKTLGSLHTRLVRRLARGQKRKPLNEIVFSEHWEVPWSSQNPDLALVDMLEHARLAPSASNGQPWRFILEADKLTLAVVRPSFIDAGIVMSHVTVAWAAAGRAGCWELRLRDEATAVRYGLPVRAIPVGTFTFSDS